ncbi:aminotransferase [Brevundimonas sp.]|uniref:aminotransferase n=3 Tax=Brevundimonas sp. TaxID=1871086 RepID=UPI002FCC47C1
MMTPHPVFADAPVTIFEKMSGLAREYGAINLGQGFPEDPGPLALRERAAHAALHGWNQYAPSRGLPELRQAVAEHYNRMQGTDLTTDQVLVTSGATEAIAAAVMAWVRSGDEVIVFEPAYDAYRPLVERAGGIVKPVRLEPPHWQITAQMLDQAIGPRTRAILFNNPMNPATKMFGADELAALAKACVAHDLVVISDEVWEHVRLTDRAHIPLATIEGMCERTIKIGSAGKMFGLTGWKVGFACAVPHLLDPVARAHQFLTFSTPPLLQTAVAEGLGWDGQWYVQMAQEMAARCEYLRQALMAQGYVCLDSHGTYFLNVDLQASGITMGDADFCEAIVREFGVAAIPVSAFVSDAEQGRIVRLCFAKPETVLDEAARRLGQARIILAKR